MAARGAQEETEAGLLVAALACVSVCGVGRGGVDSGTGTDHFTADPDVYGIPRFALTFWLQKGLTCISNVLNTLRMYLR